MTGCPRPRPRPGPAGRWVSRRAAGPCSARDRRPSTGTCRRSGGWAAPGCGWSWPAPACCTASGCAARRRRVEARDQLRAAYQMLAAMGLEGFAERARVELLATGGTVPKRSTETAARLTPQEARIVRLAVARAHQSGNQHAAVPQPAHGRVAPAQGVHEARHQLAEGTHRGAARPRARPSRRPSGPASVTGGLAAVDVQELAGDVRRVLQEQDAVDHVADLPHAPERGKLAAEPLRSFPPGTSGSG